MKPAARTFKIVPRASQKSGGGIEPDPAPDEFASSPRSVVIAIGRLSVSLRWRFLRKDALRKSPFTPLQSGTHGTRPSEPDETERRLSQPALASRQEFG